MPNEDHGAAGLQGHPPDHRQIPGHPLGGRDPKPVQFQRGGPVSGGDRKEAEGRAVMSKEELLARISEILPDDANIVYGEVTWWNEDGTFSWDTKESAQEALDEH